MPGALFSANSHSFADATPNTHPFDDATPNSHPFADAIPNTHPFEDATPNTHPFEDMTSTAFHEEARENASVRESIFGGGRAGRPMTVPDNFFLGVDM
ncbi:hypothetical protein T484DRAFT_1851686, partial [Baffinella frigidus]